MQNFKATDASVRLFLHLEMMRSISMRNWAPRNSYAYWRTKGISNCAFPWTVLVEIMNSEIFASCSFHSRS